MGQFLGFSDDHSSLVAHVRNLRTSYISPQFHVVFDDLFQTVFSLGYNNIVVDAICNQLFENNWDIYDEDEFSVDEELIYSLPPLDEVGLSEPEHEKMQAQCCQNEECQCIQVHNTPMPANPADSPEIVAVSDDDCTADSSPHDEMSESEGGILPDHPNVADDYVHDHDSVGPNVVEPDPFPSLPVSASEENQYNNHYDPLAQYQHHFQCKCT